MVGHPHHALGNLNGRQQGGLSGIQSRLSLILRCMSVALPHPLNHRESVPCAAANHGASLTWPFLKLAGVSLGWRKVVALEVGGDKPRRAKVWRLCWLALGGAAGALARYGVTQLALRYLGKQFGWGTLIANLLGCFLFGLIWSVTVNRGDRAREVGAIILTGFMGSFTTFSTFAFETTQYLQDGRWWSALLHLVGQNILGVLCVFLGVVLGRCL